MKTNIRFWVLATATTLAPLAHAAELSEGDLEAVAKVHRANQLAVNEGKVVQKQAKSPAVKDIGWMQVRDHAANDKRLLKYVNKQQLPAVEPSEAELASKQKIEKLKGLRGAAFDDAYAATVLERQQSALEVINEAIQVIEDDDLRDAVLAVRPKIEERIERAEAISTKPAAQPDAEPIADAEGNGNGTAEVDLGSAPAVDKLPEPSRRAPKFDVPE